MRKYSDEQSRDGRADKFTKSLDSRREHLLFRIAGLAFLVLIVFLITPLVHAQTTLVVDDDGHGTAANCDANAPAFSSIQAAVNAALPGDTIFICPGTYNEQVVITKDNLTIQGSGAGSTILRPSAVVANTTSLVTPIPVPVRPILLVDEATGVTVTQLTIDGSAADGGGVQLNCGFNGHFVGMYYRNSSGTVDDVHITKIRSATLCSFGIRTESGAGGSADLVFDQNLVEQYGDYGVLCAGLETTCAITGNTVRGRGPVDDQVQAGIAIRLGALASISDNTVTDHYYTPHHLPPPAPSGGIGAVAVGIFLVNADPAVNPHLLRDNVFANNELNVQRVSTKEVID